MKLVLPEEEQEVKEAVIKEEVEEETKVACNVEVTKAGCCEATAQDACTQTPRRRRRGGRGSRMKRVLAFQLMLTKRKGLPLSRLLTGIKETDSRDSKREEQMRLQEESASPLLKRNNIVKEDVKEEKEEESGPGKGDPSSGSKCGELFFLPSFLPAQFPTFCLIFKILTHFQNVGQFSKFQPILKMLIHFQNNDAFSKF